MQIKINQSILDRFGNVTIGAAVFELDVFSEKLEAYCSQNQSAMKEHYSQSAFEDIEHVKKWTAIFSAMNAKKSKESSVVFLTKYLREHDRLFHVHPVVDLYNTISVKFGLPMGAYDTKKLVGQVELRQAVKGEEFVKINGKDIEKTNTDEVVYADDAGVFCRYWNDKDSERTKITDDTRQFLFIFDGIDDYEKIHSALMELKDTLEDAKDFRYGILDAQNPQLAL
jgi:DNA/RNA-binding domain of Phe-tRNA-synthetase-like protein